MDTQTQKRLSNKLVYGPLSQKTLSSALKRELLTNFGFENMALVADLLIDRFLTIVDEFSVAPGRLQPYQTMVIGVDKREKFGYGTSISEVKLRPAVVSLITPEELLELAEGALLRAMQPRIAARIIEEAYAQGAVLALSTIALLFGVSKTTISGWIKRYQEEHPAETLHYAGIVFDMGRAQTHKGAILTLYYQGLLTQEISRRTSHDSHRVDKYIKDHQRVVAAHKADHSFDEICLLTGLSPGLVREHLDWHRQLINKEDELMTSD
jgi:hypothetical protein